MDLYYHANPDHNERFRNFGFFPRICITHPPPPPPPYHVVHRSLTLGTKQTSSREKLLYSNSNGLKQWRTIEFGCILLLLFCINGINISEAEAFLRILNTFVVHTYIPLAWSPGPIRIPLYSSLHFWGIFWDSGTNRNDLLWTKLRISSCGRYTKTAKTKWLTRGVKE